MEDLLTTRLALHPMSPAEASALLAGEPPPGVFWAPGYPTDGDRFVAGRFLTACAGIGTAEIGGPGAGSAEAGSTQPFGFYEIRRREDAHAIGGLGFHGVPDGDGQVTIGYGLIGSVRGNGYASEALRALLAFARTQSVTSVKGDADLDNIGSHRVMEAAGMRLVAVDDRLKHYRVDFTPGGGTGAN